MNPTDPPMKLTTFIKRFFTVCDRYDLIMFLFVFGLVIVMLIIAFFTMLYFEI